MPGRRIEVIGGGPAGLYAARLLKIARPDWAVTVHERMRGARDTFGFGVVLTGSTMSNLVRADPATAADIRAAAHSGHTLRLVRSGESTELHGARNLAIARSTLLDILARHASAAGVMLSTGEQTEATALDADVIIAADGARSVTREKLATELGAEVRAGRGLYMWCGADFALQDSIFAPARTDDGLFVAHAYPYARDRSTFLIESDDASLQSAGMAAHDTAPGPAGSDQHSLQYLQRAFAEHLTGHRLLGNRSRWLRFCTVHLQRWSHGNIVFIGDAAHTAHYTLGSGTKLAMEDAIALAGALLAEHDTTAAFAAYEQSRRAAVQRFQHLAARSHRWWESFPARLEHPLPTLAISFLTRAGNIDLGRLNTGGATVLSGALRCYAAAIPGAAEPPAIPGNICDWVFSQPFVHDGHLLPARNVSGHDDLRGTVAHLQWSHPDPWAPAADRIVARTRAEAAAGIWLHGEPGLPAWQGRIDMAERLKLETGRTVVVDLPPAAQGEAAAALVARRCDLIHFTE